MFARSLPFLLAAAAAVALPMTSLADEPATGAAAPAADASVAPAAEPPSRWVGRAPYVSFGGVYAVENVSGLPGGISNSGGYDIRLGYHVHDMFALELEWQSLLNFSREAVDPVTGRDEPSLEARMASFNGRFSPLSSRVQPFAVVGLGWVNVQSDTVIADTHESGFGMRFGLGVAAYLTERTGVAVEAAYILPLTGRIGGGDSFDLIPVTASVFFRFR